MVTALEDARARFEAGEYREAREAALAGLADRPDDAELLRIAGRAGVELGADDAVEQLRKVTELRGDDAAAWSDLGDALATEGRDEEAAAAFRKTLELNPDDELALTHLGHAAYASGKDDDAVAYLAQAAERTPGTSTAAISLVDMYRTLGQYEEALAAAHKVADAEPDDVAAALDVADISLTVGQLDEALKAFQRVREIEDLPDHEVHALHGMVAVEVRRENWTRALELTREALVLDPYGRTSDVLAFLEAQQGEESEEPPPSREEIDAALSASLAEHRRLHGEDRRLEGEDLGG
jgi:Flp pilus assembly protein TadD